MNQGCPERKLLAITMLEYSINMAGNQSIPSTWRAIRVFHKHGRQSQKPQDRQHQTGENCSGQEVIFGELHEAILEGMDSSLRILHFTSDILHIKCNPLSYFYSSERPYLHASKINNVFEKKYI